MLSSGSSVSEWVVGRQTSISRLQKQAYTDLNKGEYIKLQSELTSCNKPMEMWTVGKAINKPLNNEIVTGKKEVPNEVMNTTKIIIKLII